MPRFLLCYFIDIRVGETKVRGRRTIFIMFFIKETKVSGWYSYIRPGQISILFTAQCRRLECGA